MNNEHNHHTHSHNHDVENIKTAFWLNFSFTIIEIVGGIFTNSVAILSDAVHDLGDSLSLGLAWYFQKLSKKGRNKKYTYGYKRFSIIGALVTSIVILISSVFILQQAIQRFTTPESVHSEGMIYISILGIIVNGAAVFRLKKGSSLNERVVMLHLMEDVLGWVAVLIGSILILFYDIPIIDPILSICIIVYILRGVYKNLASTMRVLLQTTPENIDRPAIIEYLERLHEVAEVRDLHIWSLDGEYHILSVHLILLNPITLSEIEDLKKNIRENLKTLKIEHSTIEVEYNS